MRVTPLLAIVGILAVGWAPRVQAALDGVIDCRKAQQADETSICADLTLVQEDARMATLYAVAMSLSGMGVRGDLQDGQTKWLERRHGCKADASCLRSAYTVRIGQLQKVIDAIASRGPF